MNLELSEFGFGLLPRSRWTLENSNGAQIGAGPITISGGVFDFKDGSTPNAPVQQLRYGALGAGRGVGVNFGASLSVNQPSISSAVYWLPLSHGRLTINDFRGHFTAFDIGANAGLTFSATLILFGASNRALQLINAVSSIFTPAGPLIANNPAILALHKAAVLTAGMGFAATPNAGATMFRGQIA